MDNLRKQLRKEIRKALNEFMGLELPYFQPAGSEYMRKQETEVQRFDNFTDWETAAKQMGAVVINRRDDVIAVMPDKSRVGEWDRVFSLGTLQSLV